MICLSTRNWILLFVVGLLVFRLGMLLGRLFKRFVIDVRRASYNDFMRRRAIQKWRERDSDAGHTLYHDWHGTRCPDDCPYIPSSLRKRV